MRKVSDIRQQARQQEALGKQLGLELCQKRAKHGISPAVRTHDRLSIPGRARLTVLSIHFVALSAITTSRARNQHCVCRFGGSPGGEIRGRIRATHDEDDELPGAR